MLALLLTGLLLISGPTMAFAKENSKTADARQVRILLTAYSGLPKLRVEVFGNYTLNDALSFQRGSALEIFHLGGQLQVHYQGMSYLAGETVHLKRHRAPDDEENGLRLDGQFNLFPGDLSITYSGNQLLPVITLPMEDYLQGVVPFEMADEFPFEALKAQAIAARTYSIKNLKPGEAYDMVDSTNDQVFRGINPGKVNAIRAVRETAGKVLMYQGEPINALYTASNGGFTESALNAWGRESLPYLQIHEDSFDTENPASIVRSASIFKNISGRTNSETQLLVSYLEGLMPSRLAAIGYTEDTPFELETITGMSAHTGKYGGDTGVLRHLRVDLRLALQVPDTDNDQEVSLTQPAQDTAQSGPAPTGTSLVKKVISAAIDLPVFPDIEQLLSLSINRNENEIVSVLEKADSFELRFARYGHGVGLSQRGAEWMAKKYQWNHEQILRFYYPGTNLLTLDTAAGALPEMDMTYSATPGPAPTATPRPTLMPLTQQAAEGQYIVYVTGVAQDSSLNLRAQPDFLAEIVTRLYYGQSLLVTEEFENGWLAVRTDSVQGYVRHEYINKERP